MGGGAIILAPILNTCMLLLTENRAKLNWMTADKLKDQVYLNDGKNVG